MKTTQGVKFPLSIFWRKSDLAPGAFEYAYLQDSGGTVIAEAEPTDPYGFSQEEIDALNFIVDAANLMASKPMTLESFVQPEYKLASVRTGRMSCGLPERIAPVDLSKLGISWEKGASTFDEAVEALRKGYPAMPITIVGDTL